MISLCSICQDDSGFYFCRLCSTRYCAEHLCLHLSVAWESNTWSSREQERESAGVLKYGINTGNPDSQETSEQDSSANPTISQTPNSRTLPSFTEEQLQNMLDFYVLQARRIRAELERRAICISGVASEYDRLRQGSGYTRTRKAVRNRSVGDRKLSKVVELFARNVRAGKMTLEQIEILLRSKL